jgi:hypothetical protein
LGVQKKVFEAWFLLWRAAIITQMPSPRTADG